MDKETFTLELEKWLRAFIANKLDDYRLLEIVKPVSALNRLNIQNIKRLERSTTWEFTPNLIAIIENKSTQNLETILVNRTTKSISLREVGELKVYATIANPLYAFMASVKGSSNEVGLLMLDKDIRERCLNYGSNRNIFIFGWDENNSAPASDTVIPLESRSRIV